MVYEMRSKIEAILQFLSLGKLNLSLKNIIMMNWKHTTKKCTPGSTKRLEMKYETFELFFYFVYRDHQVVQCLFVIARKQFKVSPKSLRKLIKAMCYLNAHDSQRWLKAIDN